LSEHIYIFVLFTTSYMHFYQVY